MVVEGCIHKLYNLKDAIILSSYARTHVQITDRLVGWLVEIYIERITFRCSQLDVLPPAQLLCICLSS